jgi:hypothetical protein
MLGRITAVKVLEEPIIKTLTPTTFHRNGLYQTFELSLEEPVALSNIWLQF